MNIKEFSDQFGNQDFFTFTNHWLVYFLVDQSGEIVYVGKSSNSGLGKRLLSHSKKKDFVSYFVKSDLETETDAYLIEGAFISLLRPKYNKANLKVRSKEFRKLAEWMDGVKRETTIKKRWFLAQIILYPLIALLLALAFFGTAIGVYVISIETSPFVGVLLVVITLLLFTPVRMLGIKPIPRQ